MTLPDFDRGEIPSRPSQAEGLQKAIEVLVQGKESPKYSSSIGITCDDIDTPSGVDVHLPAGGIDSYNVTDSAYIQFMLDWKTGEPVTDGVFGVERHVTNTEHGHHMVMGALGRTARYAVDPAAQLKELLDLKARVDESRPIEEAMGMFDVSASEIEAVVSFVENAR